MKGCPREGAKRKERCASELNNKINGQRNSPIFAA
jgi:hypothetical protein